MSSYHVHAEDMAWSCHPSQGVSFKSLRYDHDDKSGAVMIHMCPNTRYPTYRATQGQDIFVVDGELLIGDERVRRGSFAHVTSGSTQAPHTEQGCVLFVSFPGAVQHLHDDER